MSRSSADPTPVRIVDSFGSKVLRALGQVVLAFLGVAMALAVAPFTPMFDSLLREWNYVEPDCEDPRELSKLDVADMVERRIATVAVSSLRDGKKWATMGTFDGRPGSGWVPATESVRGGTEVSQEKWGSKAIDHPQIQVRFEAPQQVALLCIINGNGGGSVSYTVADRVRTAHVTLAGDDVTPLENVAPLRTLPEHEVQNRQTLGVRTNVLNSDRYSQVTVEIVDRYLGTMAFDPTLGSQGDWTEPSRLVMIGELEIYVRKDS